MTVTTLTMQMEDPHALSTGWSPTQQPKQPKRAKALRQHATHDAACAGQANEQKKAACEQRAEQPAPGRGGEGKGAQTGGAHLAHENKAFFQKNASFSQQRGTQPVKPGEEEA